MKWYIIFLCFHSIIIILTICSKTCVCYHRAFLLGRQGLGKTVQMISLICTNSAKPGSSSTKLKKIVTAGMKTAQGRTSVSCFFCTVLMPVAQPLTHVVVAHIYFSGAGPTLIVAPLSVVKTWQDQFAHHVEKGALNVFIYHGTSRKSAAELQKYDVVITTYVAQHLFSIKLFLTCVVPISISSLAIVA